MVATTTTGSTKQRRPGATFPKLIPDSESLLDACDGNIISVAHISTHGSIQMCASSKMLNMFNRRAFEQGFECQHAGGLTG